MIERRVVRGRPQRVLACEREVAQSLLPVASGACPNEMVRDLRGALIDGSGIELLDRVADVCVQSLSTRGRDAGKQRLTHQLMGEGERPLRTLGTGDDYSHLLRLLDDAEQFVNIDLAYLGQELKAETAPDHCGGGQSLLFTRIKSLQAPAENQPHVFRHVDLVNLDFGEELT